MREKGGEGERVDEVITNYNERLKTSRVKQNKTNKIFIKKNFFILFKKTFFGMVQFFG